MKKYHFYIAARQIGGRGPYEIIDLEFPDARSAIRKAKTYPSNRDATILMCGGPLKEMLPRTKIV